MTSQARARVEAHLATCAECCAELEAVRQTITALSGARRVLSRLPARARWESAQRQLRTPRPAFRRQLRYGWQAAASMAVVIAVFASNLALNGARAETPSVPFIQTPAAQAVTADPATAQATRSLLSRDSTFTPTLTPGPGTTN